MKIATKTLLSLLLASSTMSRQPTLGSSRLESKRDERLQKLLAKHDRKEELRAELFNMEPADFRQLQKKYTLNEIAHQRGFQDLKSFRYALHAKIKDELHHRGWSPKRIEERLLNKLKRSN